MSLGVDLMPHKTCSLDCIYCECGKTTHLTIKRREYTPVDRILSELKSFLKDKPVLDSITFSGSGEPTLHEGIGEIINYIKTDHAQYNVAVLSNSTLFNQDKTRNDVLGADIIIASFDAACNDGFKRINRPHPMVDLKGLTEGLSLLKQDFKGRLWLEVFIVPGINDIKSELDALKKITEAITPDGIQINSLDRPGTESWVEPLGKNKLREISDFFTKAESVSYRKADPVMMKGSKDAIGVRILATLRRRPCTIEDLSNMLGTDQNKVKNELEHLVETKKIEKKVMQRGLFYKAL